MPRLGGRTTTSRHRRLNEKPGLHRPALAASHPREDQATADPEQPVFGLELEKTGIGSRRSVDVSVTICLFREVPQIEGEGDLFRQEHPRGYSKLHVVTRVPTNHLLGREGGENPVGSRASPEDLDRLLDPVPKVTHDGETFSSAQRSENAQLDVVLAVSAPRVDKVSRGVGPARAKPEERTRADLQAEGGLWPV